MESTSGLPCCCPDTPARAVLFLLVWDQSPQGVELPEGPRYTRDGLRSLLLLMGAKPRYAHKIVASMFQRATAALPELARPSRRRATAQRWACWPHNPERGEVSISLPRTDFNQLLLTCLAEFKYKPSTEDLKSACSLRERRRCVIVLLSGTSGSGKSTLASLLASRLGITTVLSTDSVRHVLRSFYSKQEAPLLFASTYEAGDLLDNMAAAPPMAQGPVPAGATAAAMHAAVLAASQAVPAGLAQLGPRERCIKGYKAQCAAVMAHLQQVIAEHEARRESLVVEGVHLSISQVVRLMARHPSVVPFLLYIKSEAKHVERMAVRAKYMTLDPHKNKYVAHMPGIRWIQDYLVKKAEKRGLPRVENTNVDRSVGLIHMTLLGVLRRVVRGEPVLDPSTSTARALLAEYAAAVEGMVHASKGIVDALQQQQQPTEPTATTQPDQPLLEASSGQEQPTPAATANNTITNNTNNAITNNNTSAAAAGPPASGPEPLDSHPMLPVQPHTAGEVPGADWQGQAVRQQHSWQGPTEQQLMHEGLLPGASGLNPPVGLNPGPAHPMGLNPPLGLHPGPAHAPAGVMDPSSITDLNPNLTALSVGHRWGGLPEPESSATSRLSTPQHVVTPMSELLQPFFGRVSAGYVSGGHVSGGYVSAGHNSVGHVSGGHVSAGPASAGHVSAGHNSAGHNSGGYVSTGHVSGAEGRSGEEGQGQGTGRWARGQWTASRASWPAVRDDDVGGWWEDGQQLGGQGQQLGREGQHLGGEVSEAAHTVQGDTARSDALGGGQSEAAVAHAAADAAAGNVNSTVVQEHMQHLQASPAHAGSCGWIRLGGAAPGGGVCLQAGGGLQGQQQQWQGEEQQWQAGQQQWQIGQQQWQGMLPSGRTDMHASDAVQHHHTLNPTSATPAAMSHILDTPTWPYATTPGAPAWDAPGSHPDRAAAAAAAAAAAPPGQQQPACPTQPQEENLMGLPMPVHTRVNRAPPIGTSPQSPLGASPIGTFQNHKSPIGVSPIGTSPLGTSPRGSRSDPGAGAATTSSSGGTRHPAAAGGSSTYPGCTGAAPAALSGQQQQRQKLAQPALRRMTAEPAAVEQPSSGAAEVAGEEDSQPLVNQGAGPGLPRFSTHTPTATAINPPPGPFAPGHTSASAAPLSPLTMTNHLAAGAPAPIRAPAGAPTALSPALPATHPPAGPSPPLPCAPLVLPPAPLQLPRAPLVLPPAPLQLPHPLPPGPLPPAPLPPAPRPPAPVDVFASSDEDANDDDRPAPVAVPASLFTRSSKHSSRHSSRTLGRASGRAHATSAGQLSGQALQELEAGLDGMNSPDGSSPEAVVDLGQQAHAGVGGGGHMGHSSAAESDLDYLTLLDYASVYESTAALDDVDDDLPGRTGPWSPRGSTALFSDAVAGLQGAASLAQASPDTSTGGAVRGTYNSAGAGVGDGGAGRGVAGMGSPEQQLAAAGRALLSQVGGGGEHGQRWFAGGGVGASSGSGGGAGVRGGPRVGQGRAGPMMANATMLRHLASALAHSRQRGLPSGGGAAGGGPHAAPRSGSTLRPESPTQSGRGSRAVAGGPGGQQVGSCSQPAGATPRSPAQPGAAAPGGAGASSGERERAGRDTRMAARGLLQHDYL